MLFHQVFTFCIVNRDNITFPVQLTAGTECSMHNHNIHDATSIYLALITAQSSTHSGASTQRLYMASATCWDSLEPI